VSFILRCQRALTLFAPLRPFSFEGYQSSPYPSATDLPSNASPECRETDLHIGKLISSSQTQLLFAVCPVTGSVHANIGSLTFTSGNVLSKINLLLISILFCLHLGNKAVDIRIDTFRCGTLERGILVPNVSSRKRLIW
jgi:hypothetical protein